jgi:general secretion pathway protein F
MPVYEYKAINQDGKTIRSTLESDSLRNARSKLKKDGFFVVELRDKQKAKTASSKKRTSSAGGVNVSERAMMTRQLATLLKANIPLVEALNAVTEQVENPNLKEAMSDIKNMVNEGATLHAGLAKYPKIFNHIYVTMCEAQKPKMNSPAK